MVRAARDVLHVAVVAPRAGAEQLGAAAMALLRRWQRRRGRRRRRGRKGARLAPVCSCPTLGCEAFQGCQPERSGGQEDAEQLGAVTAVLLLMLMLPPPRTADRCSGAAWRVVPQPRRRTSWLNAMLRKPRPVAQDNASLAHVLRSMHSAHLHALGEEHVARVAVQRCQDEHPLPPVGKAKACSQSDRGQGKPRQLWGGAHAQQAQQAARCQHALGGCHAPPCVDGSQPQSPRPQSQHPTCTPNPPNNPCPTSNPCSFPSAACRMLRSASPAELTTRQATLP